MDKATRHLHPHVTIFCLRHGGTHLIKPLVKRLANLPMVDVGKRDMSDHVPIGPVVVAFRDPRNVMVAMRKWELRRAGKSIVPDRSHDKAISRLIGNHMEFMTKGVNAWVDRPAIRTTFEALTGLFGDHEANRIGCELGCAHGAGADALTVVWGTGHTYTGEFSDHRKWFGPLSIAAWDHNGGAALLAKMGYGQ